MNAYSCLTLFAEAVEEFEQIQADLKAILFEKNDKTNDNLTTLAYEIYNEGLKCLFNNKDYFKLKKLCNEIRSWQSIKDQDFESRH